MEIQRGQFACWRVSQVPGKDTSHPYAQQHTLKQRVLLPRTRAELRADERLLNRFRRALPRRCWALPDPWRGPAMDPSRASDPDPDPALAGFVDPARAEDQRRAVPRLVCELM